MRKANLLVMLILALSAGVAQAATINSAGSGLWTNPATWTPAQVPTAADAVTILNGHTITNSDVLVHDAGSLTINSGGVLTHLANTSNENYKIMLNITGNLAVNSGGQINADAKGYAEGKGPGIWIVNDSGSSYGGVGGRKVAYPASRPGRTYGSATAPTNLGSGGRSTLSGGGAIILTVSGTSTIQGLISAGGSNDLTRIFGGAAGGSVYLRTGHLAGAGTIQANGSTSGWPQGGGGRVAVILMSDTDFGNVRMQAYSGTADGKGAAGTIYLEHTGHSSGNGKLIVNYNDLIPEDRVLCATWQNMVEASAYTFSEIILTNGGVYALDTNDTLAITDVTTVRGDPTDQNDGIYLRGGALNVPASFNAYSNYFIWIAEASSTFNPPTSLTVGTNAAMKIDVPWTMNCPLTIAAGGFMHHSGNITNYPSVTNLTVSGNLNIQSGGVVTATVIVVGGTMNLQSNGLLTHAANTTNELYKLVLNIASNMTIDAGGQINVDGRGYAARQGPGKQINPRCAGSYGGVGGPYVAVPGSTSGPTYGSITAPTNCGSGGDDWPGGGAVLLAVAGTSAVNGVISSSGFNRSGNTGPAGAGGSVFLTTGRLTGNGTIMADGGNEFGFSAPSGGGGRIAVLLQNSADFGAVNIHAYPGTRQSGSASGAGTVYLEAQTQSPGQGTLVIDAGNRIIGNNTCLISSNVTDTVVGTVIITNRAIFKIDTNQTLTVNRDWINTGGPNLSFIANTGSTLILGSTNTATVSGSNTFYNLACTNSGKTVLFTAGTTNFVAGQLALGPRVALKSTVDNAWWHLTLAPGGTQQIKSVAVQDSNAGGGQELVAPIGSLNLGNNVNWVFLKYRGTILRGQ